SSALDCTPRCALSCARETRSPRAILSSPFQHGAGARTRFAAFFRVRGYGGGNASMRREFGGQKFGGFEAAIFVQRDFFTRAKNRGHADRSLIFHVLILFSGRVRAGRSFPRFRSIAE